MPVVFRPLVSPSGRDVNAVPSNYSPTHLLADPCLSVLPAMQILAGIRQFLRNPPSNRQMYDVALCNCLVDEMP